MKAKIEFNELFKLINCYEDNENNALTIADYLDNVDYEVDLSHYIWNTRIFNVEILDSKEDAIKYVQNNLCCDVDDCTIFESDVTDKVYLEW